MDHQTAPATNPQFARHIALIRAQEPHIASPRFAAWLEGPAGLELRETADRLGITVAAARELAQAERGATE